MSYENPWILFVCGGFKGRKHASFAIAISSHWFGAYSVVSGIYIGNVFSLEG